MLLIFGLGNPGTKYKPTRHNAGFLALEAFAKQHRGSWRVLKSWNAEVVDLELDGTPVRLVKPQTFMNLSGQTVAAARRASKTQPERMLVVCDDADLPFGTIRFRATGGSGGQRGLQSIIETIGTPNFARLRIGIGRSPDPRVPLDAWVLQKFSKEEQDELPAIIKKAIKAIEEWVYASNSHHPS